MGRGHPSKPNTRAILPKFRRTYLVRFGEFVTNQGLDYEEGTWSTLHKQFGRWIPNESMARELFGTWSTLYSLCGLLNKGKKRLQKESKLLSYMKLSGFERSSSNRVGKK